MFRNGTIMVALLIIVIVIASSLAVSSGFVSHAFPAKTIDYNGVTNTMVQPDDDNTDKSNSPKSRSSIIGDSNAGIGNATGISEKALKHLSKCESDAAEDGHLKRGEVRDCYLEAFTLY
jgi:hypothetical protein